MSEQQVHVVPPAEDAEVAQPAEGISFYDGEFFGDIIMAIDLDCGERISFSVEDIPENRRNWLGNSVQAQVNRIIARRVHKGIEFHKAATRALFEPSAPPKF